MKKSNFWKSYGFLILMLTGIVAGCVGSRCEGCCLHQERLR